MGVSELRLESARSLVAAALSAHLVVVVIVVAVVVAVVVVAVVVVAFIPGPVFHFYLRPSDFRKKKKKMVQL